jgi:hypothetical protein
VHRSGLVFFTLATLATCGAHAQTPSTSYPVGTVLSSETSLEDYSGCSVSPSPSSLYASALPNSALVAIGEAFYDYPPVDNVSLKSVSYAGAARFVFLSPTAKTGAVIFDSVTPYDAYSGTRPAAAKITFTDYKATPNPTTETVSVTATLRFTAPGEAVCTVPFKAVYHITK